MTVTCHKPCTVPRPEKAEELKQPQENPPRSLRLSTHEAAIFRAINDGERDYEEVLRTARIHLGLARLGPADPRVIRYRYQVNGHPEDNLE